MPRPPGACKSSSNPPMSDTTVMITATATTLRVLSIGSLRGERIDPFVGFVTRSEIGGQAGLRTVPLRIDHPNEAREPVVKRCLPVTVQVLAICRPQPKLSPF